jgi:hypothetical protein
LFSKNLASHIRPQAASLGRPSIDGFDKDKNMKLCKLLHEAENRCPTCGGKITPAGYDPSLEVHPNKKGEWIHPETGEVLHRSSDPSMMGMTQDEVRRMSNAETQALPDKTKRFRKVLQPPKRKRKKKKLKNHPGMMQAILRYRKEIADAERT